MTWLSRIVNEANNRRFIPREKIGAEKDNLKFIPHDRTAFRPGDKVLYTRNTGKGVVDRYGIIQRVEGDFIIFTDEGDANKKEYKRDIFDRAKGSNVINDQLKHCISWIQPVIESGAWRYTATDYIVSYETSNNLEVTDKHKPKEDDELHKVQDGMPLVVVWLKNDGNKQYYKWPDGEFVGGVNVSAMNVGNTLWLPKKDTPEPAKVYKEKFNPSFYVMIPEEYSDCMVFDKYEKFLGWNFKYCFYLLEKCPWLQTMKVNWYIPKDGRVLKNYCILDNPQVKAKWESLH